MDVHTQQTAPSDRELIQRAREMIPALRARQAACEALGRVPDETIKTFEEAGFFRILQPAMFGGYEKSPLTFYQVLQEVASGCPSSGWVLMVLGIHNWEVALLDPQAGRDLWAANDAVRISSSYAPFGKAETVEGGYRVSGRWRFSSGCEHANWVFLGAYVPTGPDTPPDYRVFLIPRADYQIHQDTWNVFGLAGTGSKDVEVPGCFVPAYRSHSLIEHFTAHGNDIGLKTHTSPYYRIPFGVAFHNGVASVIAGMIRGMVAVFCEQMQIRRDNWQGQTLSTNPALQRRVQLADAKARAATNLIRGVVEGCLSYLLNGEPIPLDKRAQYVGDAATVGEWASEASVLLLRGAGGKAVFSDNPLQRYFRDLQAGCNHVCMDLDKLGTNAGGTLLGLPNQVPVT
jgi:3-hydroxy-9,10-secoandrosta-1,3,5(10)-triene-9,17-dione monooxygenase